MPSELEVSDDWAVASPRANDHGPRVSLVDGGERWVRICHARNAGSRRRSERLVFEAMPESGDQQRPGMRRLEGGGEVALLKLFNIRELQNVTSARAALLCT
jgi:hypothetical protein